MKIISEKKDYIKCIILELMVPKMNGLEFLSKLKNFSPSKVARIPVILITADTSSDSKELALASARLQKPIDCGLLFQVIKDQVALLT